MPILDHFIRGGGETNPYNLTSHTPILGNTWAVTGGTSFTITTDSYASNTNGSGVNVNYWTGDVGTDDYEVAIIGRYTPSLENYSTLAPVVRLFGSTGVLCRMYCDGSSGAAVVNLQAAFNPYTTYASINLASGTIFASRDYYLVGKAVGSTISFSIKDMSTNLWLKSDGTFSSSTRVNAVTASIGGLPVRGNIGIQDYSTATTARVDLIAYGQPDSNPGTYNLSFTGPTSGGLNIPSSNFTVSISPALTTETIKVSGNDNATGTFFPTFVTLTSGSSAGTFTYTPVTSGNKIISITNDFGLANPSSITYTPTASALIVTGPSSCTVGLPSSNFTVGANAFIPYPITVTPSGFGTFNPTSFIISSVAPSGTFTYSASAAGLNEIVITNNFSIPNITTTISASAAAQATLVQFSGPSSGLLGNNSTNFTVSLNGSVASNVTVTPSAASGTFIPTSVVLNNSTPSQTFVYSPSASGIISLSISNNGGLANEGPLNYNVLAASTYTLTGPTSGNINTASSNFTVTLSGGGITGSCIITPNVSGSNSGFTPSTVTLNNTNTFGTFTYTPTSSGYIVIGTTNNRGLTDPQSLTYYSTPVQIFYPDDSRIIKSPTNWNFTGTIGQQTAETVWVGSYMRFAFNGTDLTINVSTAGLGSYPWVYYQIDSDNPTVTKLTPGQTQISINGLSASNHEIVIIYQARDNYNQANTWSDSQKLVITSFNYSGGTGLLSSMTSKPKKSIIWGDSITAGLSTSSPPGVSTAVGINAATASYSHHLGILLNSEFDQCGCGADGWTVGGVGNFPNFPNGWNYKKNGVSRDVSIHDYMLVIHGYNDGASDISSSIITNQLTAMRSANSTAWIFLLVPFSGRQRGSITTGVNNYISSNPTEQKIKTIDLGSTYYQAQQNGYFTTDGIHPNAWESARLAVEYYRIINTYLSTGSSGGEYSFGFSG